MSEPCTQTHLLSVAVMFRCFFRFLCTIRISVHPVTSFPPTVLLPGAALPSPIGQGSFGLSSPVFGTMTALRLLITHPVRFALLFSRYCRLAPVSCCHWPLSSWSRRKARCTSIPPCPSAVLYLRGVEPSHVPV